MDIPSVCFPFARDDREELLEEKRGKPAIEMVVCLHMERR
jgi:hypothetical protein